MDSRTDVTHSRKETKQLSGISYVSRIPVPTSKIPASKARIPVPSANKHIDTSGPNRQCGKPRDKLLCRTNAISEGKPPHGRAKLAKEASTQTRTKPGIQTRVKPVPNFKKLHKKWDNKMTTTCHTHGSSDMTHTRTDLNRSFEEDPSSLQAILNSVPIQPKETSVRASCIERLHMMQPPCNDPIPFRHSLYMKKKVLRNKTDHTHFNDENREPPNRFQELCHKLVQSGRATTEKLVSGPIREREHWTDLKMNLERHFDDSPSIKTSVIPSFQSSAADSTVRRSDECASGSQSISTQPPPDDLNRSFEEDPSSLQAILTNIPIQPKETPVRVSCIERLHMMQPPCNDPIPFRHSLYMKKKVLCNKTDHTHENHEPPNRFQELCHKLVQSGRAATERLVSGPIREREHWTDLKMNLERHLDDQPSTLLTRSPSLPMLQENNTIYRTPCKSPSLSSLMSKTPSVTKTLCTPHSVIDVASTHRSCTYRR